VLAEIAAPLKRFFTSGLWLLLRPRTVMRFRFRCSFPLAVLTYTRGPGFADRFEALLDQLELVWGEGIVFDEIIGILELAERHAAVLKSERAFEDVASLPEGGVEFTHYIGSPMSIGDGERIASVRPANSMALVYSPQHQSEGFAQCQKPRNVSLELILQQR
jgi:hypothetical protein